MDAAILLIILTIFVVALCAAEFLPCPKTQHDTIKTRL